MWGQTREIQNGEDRKVGRAAALQKELILLDLKSACIDVDPIREFS